MRAGVAAVALLALVSVVLTGCGEATRTSASQDAWWSSAPEGTRWVGVGRAVVAVPDGWSTGETQCLTPVADTVYFDNGAQADCSDPVDPATVREVSALAVLDARQGYGDYLVRDMRAAGDVSGREVREREECERWFAGVCRRLFAVPSEGVVFAVTVADPTDGDYQTIRESLRLLPEGLTTVPLAAAEAGWTPTAGAEPAVSDEVVATLIAAGLRVERVTGEPPGGATPDGGLPRGSLLGVSPGLGSVVEVGGTVTVSVSG